MRFLGSISAAGILAALVLAAPGECQLRRKPPAQRPLRPPVLPPPPGLAIIDRLERMTPEERDRALSKLPPERRKRVEERLAEFDSLPPAERERLRNRLETFTQLPPERQDATRRLFARFNLLTQERRQVVREEFRRLLTMDEAGRRARIDSDESRSRFTPAEQQLLQDFSALLVPPPP